VGEYSNKFLLKYFSMRRFTKNYYIPNLNNLTLTDKPMKYSQELKNKGFEMKIRKECEDDEGYDLYLTVSKGDSFLDFFYSLSNSKGYYFTSDSTDCNGDGCDWDIDGERLVCEYLGVEQLKEIS
tara:strand:+ start:51 stop:425 length:375 start_codon:yes stop_codon:yes gene_type:complete